MYKIKMTSAYKKGYKRMEKRGMNMTLLDDVVGDLCQGKTLDEKYNDHILKGKYTGFHECHILSDWILIYLIKDNILTLTLSFTGTHQDVFKGHY